MSTSAARLLGPLSSSHGLPPCLASSHRSSRRSESRSLYPESTRFIHRHHHHHHEAPHWPTNPNPTPYDIFNITRDATYTKRRFYELVKLYHPDRYHQSHKAQLSSAARIERYRLVVMANAILSDPAKRHAYDICGAGWTQPPSLSSEAYDAWRKRKDTPAANATWEDWERWYDARNGNTQRPVYMSHGSFAALVVMFVSIGVVAQTHRADSLARERMMLIQQRQELLARDTSRRAESSVTKGRDARVEIFVRERENALYEYQPEKWDAQEVKPP